MIVKPYIHPAFYSGEDDSDVDFGNALIQIELRDGTSYNLIDNGDGSLTVSALSSREMVTLGKPEPETQA